MVVVVVNILTAAMILESRKQLPYNVSTRKKAFFLPAYIRCFGAEDLGLRWGADAGDSRGRLWGSDVEFGYLHSSEPDTMEVRRFLLDAQGIHLTRSLRRVVSSESHYLDELFIGVSVKDP